MTSTQPIQPSNEADRPRAVVLVSGGLDSATTLAIARHEAGEIPVTYVPARNLVFLSYATALAESIGANDIYLGVNAVDYSGYPDCRPVFIEAFQCAARLATKAGAEGSPLRVNTPLIEWTKAQIIRRGVELGVDYALTHSCYDPDGQGRACGRCDSCILRKAGFERAQVADPTVYAPG